MTSIPMSEIQNTTSEWFWLYCESMLTAAAAVAAAVAAPVNLQSRPIPIAGTRRLPDKSDFNGELELQWSLLGAVSCGLVRLSVLSAVAKRDYADYVTSRRNQDELSEQCLLLNLTCFPEITMVFDLSHLELCLEFLVSV